MNRYFLVARDDPDESGSQAYIPYSGARPEKASLRVLKASTHSSLILDVPVCFTRRRNEHAMNRGLGESNSEGEENALYTRHGIFISLVSRYYYKVSVLSPRHE